jgi:hypothetical protein
VQPLADATGNAAGAWQGSLSIFALGATASKLTFASPMGALFGLAEWVDSAAQPFCDSDGCVQAESFVEHEPMTGIAGRLFAPSMSEIRVRYRQVVLASPAPAPSSIPLRLDVAAPGIAPVTFILPGSTTHEVAGTYVTDWTTFTTPLPSAMANAPEIGFALLTTSASIPCNIYSWLSIAVLVDEVSVQ